MDPKFGCKQCGKTYKWKPEFAGKKVKCKCGYVMTAPAKVETAAVADAAQLSQPGHRQRRSRPAVGRRSRPRPAVPLRPSRRSASGRAERELI